MTPELEARIKEARSIAVDQFNMDPGDVRFIVAPSHIMYATAAHGLPGMWSHWSDGREYWIYKAQHDAGVMTIYEMVVNTEPRLALLLDSNTDITNVMVAAHVFGHTHLDGANIYFKGTNPHILETVATWAKRIEGYEEEYGDLVVEAFIDKVMSLEPYVDARFDGKAFKEDKPKQQPLAELLPAPPPEKPEKIFQPTGDLYGFIAKYAEGLEDWQRDILNIYRERMLYFKPMLQCKVIHEGFASIAHRRIMEKMTVSDAEWLEYSKLTSGVMSPAPGGGVNPYWLGHAILEAIEKKHGWQALLDVVAVEDDVSLIRSYVTEELCDDLNLFSFSFYPEERQWIAGDEPKDWEVIRDALIKKFDNYRSPVIEIDDFDHEGKRGLHLTHRYDGRRLNMQHAEAALVAISDLWGQRSYLRTTLTKGEVEGVAYAPSEREERGQTTDWEPLWDK